MTKHINHDPENNQKGGVPTTAKKKENQGFQLSPHGIHYEFLLHFDGDLKELYDSVNVQFQKLFGSRITISEGMFNQERIPLLAILINIKNFHELYQEALIKDPDNKALTDSYQALALRLQHLQCKLSATYFLIESSTKRIYPLVEKHKGFFKMLNARTFFKEPSMLKHFPNEPVPTYPSTFKHIAKELKPIDVELREMISVFNFQWYGPEYQYWRNPKLFELVNQFAPPGLVSVQTDLYYLFRSFILLPELTAEQRKQWDQYIKDGSELINLILSYPNSDWSLLHSYMSTQKINIPVTKFFARSTPTDKVEPLSKRTFSLFLDCSNRFIGLLWVTLLAAITEPERTVPVETKGVEV